MTKSNNAQAKTFNPSKQLSDQLRILALNMALRQYLSNYDDKNIDPVFAIDVLENDMWEIDEDTSLVAWQPFEWVSAKVLVGYINNSADMYYKAFLEAIRIHVDLEENVPDAPPKPTVTIMTCTICGDNQQSFLTIKGDQQVCDCCLDTHYDGGTLDEQSS